MAARTPTGRDIAGGDHTIRKDRKPGGGVETKCIYTRKSNWFWKACSCPGVIDLHTIHGIVGGAYIADGDGTLADYIQADAAIAIKDIFAGKRDAECIGGRGAVIQICAT